MAKRRVLLVEDDETIRLRVRGFFTNQGYDVAEAVTMEAALAELDLHLPDAAIVDFQLPDGDAIELLQTVKQLARDVPVVLLTGPGSIDRAVSALKAGADHFINKPVELPILAAVVERAIENRVAKGTHARDDGHGDATMDMTLEALERMHILRVYQASGGRVETAARRLGIPRSTLYQKLRQFGVTLRR